MSFREENSYKMINAHSKELLKNKREKKYLKFLAYSMTDPLTRGYRGLLSVVEQNVGYVYLLLMFFTSGITTVLSKYLMMGRLNPFHILTYTSFVGLVVLVGFNYKKGVKAFINVKPGFWTHVIIAISGFSLYEITFNIALMYMSVSQTIIVYYSHPIFLYFASWIFLHKGKKGTMNKKVWIGIALSFAGVYFVLTGGKLLRFSPNMGMFYIFISIISITIFTILGKKIEVPELQFLTLGQLISFVSGIIILSAANLWVMPSIRETLFLVFIAVVYNIINMVFYLKTIQFLSVEKLSTLTYLSPIVTSALAILILKEPLLISIVVGLGLVIVGNVIASIKNNS